MSAVTTVLFKDDAGNNVATVSYNGEEWVATCAVCDDDRTLNWTFRDPALVDAVHVAAGHLRHHYLVGTP